MEMDVAPPLKRFLSLLGLLVVVAFTAAVYLLYAPEPALPEAAATTVTVDFGGRERRYIVFTPPNLHAGAGVLLAFHPSMSSATEMRQLVGIELERIADKDNLVVVYPRGYDGHFNGCSRTASYQAHKLRIDDVGFARSIVDELAKQQPIDRSRVYAIGLSNGGQMALRLALEAPDLVRGVAALSASLPAPENLDCTIAASPSRNVVLVAGTRDPINPYDGGEVTLFGFSSRGKVLSAQASAQWFADRLGLVTPTTTDLEKDRSGHEARQQDWLGTDAHVRLVTLVGTGHTVPQSRYRARRLLGATFESDALLESTLQLLTEDSPRG
jgi:polyhydroxybutyrate depolymerase